MTDKNGNFPKEEWMDELAIARALHVLGVVIWIGGVSMATTAALPALRHGVFGPDRLAAFQAFERRFVWQARSAVVLVGLSGLFMVMKMDLWSRFSEPGFWWMHAMVGLWLVFALVLFVAEPLVLHRHFNVWAKRDPEAAFAVLQRVHAVLLVLGLVTIFGAVAGSHGWSLF
ncbi:hypothetical protein [Acetobacter sp.]|uniref:hypothetical protein n=1 Tax=Acetobacter sp. TaxID=440 RepID=UPI0039EB760F